MKRSSLSSENWRMKFEISVKIYSKKKEIFISKKNYSFVIRFLEFQSRFSIHFLQPAILSHYSNNFQSVGDPFVSSRRGEKVGANTILAFLPSLFFFFFPFLFHLYIQLLVLAHLFLFVLTASRTERRVIIFLFCWHSANIVSHFLGTKRSYHLLYLLFSRRTIFPF